MFQKLLVANRGEIACRVIRTAKRLGVKTVAVYSEPDEGSLHVRMADEAYCIGPAASDKSYLNMHTILDVAKQSGAQAIHPGYGFLSENAAFARLCEQEGLVFVGPPPSAIRDMGRKDLSKQIMAAAGVPVVKGYDQEEQGVDFLRNEAKKIGFPVMLKAVKGGGGKGMRVAQSEADFDLQLQQAKEEAMSSFSDDQMIIEKFVDMPRHVEVQVFADQHGNTVYLYERDCSVQRRHQKIIEESPAPGLSDDVRREIGEAAVRAAQAVGYVGAGTVEFLMDADQKFFFMEMNTRLQVEHPVTEMVTGTDLVEWQLKVAAGEKLSLSQADIKLRGHAFEARVYAEKTVDSPTGPTFMPSSGNLFYLSAPETSDSVRLETGVLEGDDVLTFYDPMIAKLVVWAPDRLAALKKLRRSLCSYHIVGPSTNIGFLDRLAGHDAFVSGNVHTDFIPMHGQSLCSDMKKLPNDSLSQAALFLLLLRKQASSEIADSSSPFLGTSAARINLDSTHLVRFVDGDKLVSVRASVASDGDFLMDIERRAMPLPRSSVKKSKKGKAPQAMPKPAEVESCRVNGSLSRLTGKNQGWVLTSRVDGRQCKLTAVQHENTVHLFTDNGEIQVPLYKPSFVGGAGSQQHSGNAIFPPMTSEVIQVLCKPGEKVAKDDVLVVVKAMKMRTVIRSPRDGVVEKVSTSEGSQVSEKTVLVTLAEEEEVD